jgi:signal transduction histidine kinase
VRTKFGVLRTQSFRIILIYVLLFALSVSALLGFTYWNTRRTLDAQTDQIIEAEITGLSEQYQQLGMRGLAEAVMSRSLHGGQGLYLLSDANHRRIAGNLDSWPDIKEDGSRFVEFDYERPINGKLQTRLARGRAFLLAGGAFQLLVAQDVQERYLTERLFTTALPWTLGLILLLGLAGGALMSRNMLRRLDSINRTASDIVAGDLSLRVPVSGAHDEYDALAENLNRMLERIERLMKGMREVTDSVAHDLRTPLNRLRNRLEQNLGRLNASGAQTAQVEAAIAETDSLIATFNALLLIAEADAGAARGAMAPIDLAPVAEDVVDLYAPLADEKNVALRLLPAGVTMIEGNRSLIAQALANLVDNAIKYTPSGGTVTIAPAVSYAGVELSVADTGPGIPAAERTRVVERFVRLEASRNTPGTGLGLSLVAAVAHLHNAALILDDNAPGLKVTIRFPRPPPRIQVPPRPQTVPRRIPV